MGSIKRRAAPALVMALCLALPLAAQAPQTQSLAAEVQGIERLLQGGGGNAAERRGALIRLARLYQLAGNLEGAARAWTDAAAAEGAGREGPLLEGALAWMALGEYDRARSNLNAVLAAQNPAAGGGREILLGARYLAAQLAAFSGGNLRDLAQLAEDPDYRDYRPAIWYTLWRLSADTAWRSRLLAEYPASPEGRIASADRAETVGPVPQALWYLYPGRESLTAAAAPIPLTAPPIPPGPSLLPPVTTDLSELSGSGSRGQALIQTGLFSREENARAQVKRLGDAGFSAAASRRQINGTSYWAVTVPPGADINQTIRRLKNAGFESFPVF